MAEKLNNFEKFKRMKNQISALFSTQTLPHDWPDALDLLTIDLVAKIHKTWKNMVVVIG